MCTHTHTHTHKHTHTHYGCPPLTENFVKYTLTASLLVYHPVPSEYCDCSVFPHYHMLSLLFQRLSHWWLWQRDMHSVPVCARTHTHTHTYTHTHTHTHSWGEAMVKCCCGLAKCSADSASFEWSHRDLASVCVCVCVCVCCVFCVLALAHIQLLPPLPSWLETMNPPPLFLSPMWPTVQ